MKKNQNFRLNFYNWNNHFLHRTLTIQVFVYLFILITSSSLLQAQTLANKVWIANGGIPADNISYQQSILDNNEQLIIVGNSYTTGQEENVWITKYDNEGTLIWQYEYNYFSNGKDYATNVAVDNNNDIYVTGGVFNAVSNSFDYLTMKLSETGNLLWVATHDVNSLDDIAIDLAVDNNGNVYVTGGSQISVTDWNYFTIKYSTTGTMLWQQQYDFANLRDIAANIEIVGSQIVVTGASANTAIEWDYATISYDENGSLQNTERTSFGTAGFDQPIDLVQDVNNNIHITGRATQNGSNYDIQTIQLNNNLALNWTVNFDGNGLEDAAADLEIDDNGNVYVVGYTQTSATDTDILVLKYNQAGVLQWSRTRTRLDENGQATAATIDEEGRIVVTGQVQNGIETDFITLIYTPEGDLEWENRYDNASQNDNANGIETDSEGNIYVTGISNNGMNSSYNTFKYETYERNLSIENDNAGKPTHVEHELIIRFRKEIVNLSFVNDKEAIYAPINQVITDAIAISDLQNAIGAGEDFEDWILIKVYPSLTSEMTTTSRMGRTFVVPDIWTTFVLKIDRDFDSEFMEFVASDNIMADANLKKYIKYAEPNLVFQNTADAYDDLYFSQKGFYNPDYGINVEGAWDFTTGEDFVKVGVFDMGLNWRHDDFDESLGSQTAGLLSKVKGGFNCDVTPIIPTSSTSPTLPSNTVAHHGMGVAGIIGGMRNNYFNTTITSCNTNRRGIAGIAGGDWCDGLNSVEKGVSLYDFQVQIGASSQSNNTPASNFASGYILATQSGGNGVGVHITNHSYGIPSTSPSFYTYSNVMKDAIYFMYRNDAITVFSRGNFDNDNHQAPVTTVDEEWILSVGGSGVQVNIDPLLSGRRHTNSSFGKEVDLIAPYDQSVIKSLGLANQSNNHYLNFSGTSAAAPHVVGVASLLLSYLNNPIDNINNLNHDDVENILQLTTTDVENTGYDNWSGWGRLNATAALEFVDKSQYHVLHFPELGAGTSMTLTPTNTLFDFYQPNHISTQGNKHYLVLQAYEVTITYSHQSYVGNGQVENAWIRNSAAQGYQNTFNLHELDYEWCELLSVNNQQAVTRTYLYKIIGYHNSTLQNYTPNPNAQYDWWGIPPYSGNIKCPYTLRVSGMITNSNQVLNETKSPLKVFPVPTEDNVTIQFDLKESSMVSLNLYDLNGRLIKSLLSGTETKGEHQINVSLENLTAGVYICKLQMNNQVFTEKIIKIQ